MNREKENKRNKINAIAAGVLAALTIIYGSYELSNMYYFQSESEARLQEQLKLESLRNENNESERIKNNAEQLEKALAKAEEQFSTLTPLVPTQGELPQIQESLARKATERNLKFDFFTRAAEPKPSGSMLEIPLKVDVVGYYDSIGRYIEEFSRFERLLKVTSITMRLEKAPIPTGSASPNLDPQAKQMIDAIQGSMVTVVRGTINFSAYVSKEKPVKQVSQQAN
jgi:Tfp pilus assembly protein PilO